MKDREALFPTLISEDLEKQIPYIYLVGYSDRYELDFTIRSNQRMIDLHNWFAESEGINAQAVIRHFQTKDLIAQIIDGMHFGYEPYNGRAQPIFIMAQRKYWLELSDSNLNADFFIGNSIETSDSLKMRTIDVRPINYDINYMSKLKRFKL